MSGDGHRALEAWGRQFGQIARWGVEGTSSWGRHTAVFWSVAAMTCAACAQTARRGLTGRASAGSPTRLTQSGSPATNTVRPRQAALATRNRRRRYDQPTTLRLTLLDAYRAQIAKLNAQDTQVTAELAALVKASGSTLGELCDLSTVLVSELLVEVGDLRRFTIGGFARFNASAALTASTAEGPGEPVRHRYNPGGTVASTGPCT